ncbi:MAG: CoB--CoM heterodisulfide reductase iron-sulfur subunit B family protein [Candidatus Ranarchaeia archaeon]
MTSNYTYYPGCSLTGTNKSYDTSLKFVFDKLGINLEEIPDWNCCGTTAYLAMKEIQAFGLTARNLALASELDSDEVLIPCNGCFTNFKKANDHLKDGSSIKKRIEHALSVAGLDYKKNVEPKHILDVLVNSIGEEKVRGKVTKPLKGLKVAPYYGCQTSRPFALFDDPEFPVSMDRLLSWLGAEVVDYPVKTKCCGGTLITTDDELVLPLIDYVVNNARKAGADIIATCCPLCQTNVEMFQPKTNKKFKRKSEVPVLYFTQLMGLAMGGNFKDCDIGREIVNAKKVLRQYAEREKLYE